MAGKKRKREEIENEDSGPPIQKAKFKAQEGCRLLSLPPELRNKIYEYALVSEKKIVVVPGTTKPPALLATCRQIDIEARPIWIGQNVFFITIMDCDGSTLLRWEGRIRKFLSCGQMIMKFKGAPSWSNLLAWCKGYLTAGRVMMMRKRKDPAPDAPSQSKAFACAFTCAFSVVQDSLEFDRSWEKTEEKLDFLRSALALSDKRWLD